MTIALEPLPADFGSPAASPPASGASVPESWNDIRADSDIQFEEIGTIPTPPPEPVEPSEPNWFIEALQAFFNWLGDLLAPIGSLIAWAWPVLQWVLLAALVAFVLYLIFKTIGPIARKGSAKGGERKAISEPEWQPDREESLTLLEDADRLAAEGRFDEATHLLLQRSVGQIAEARPDWVEPSSTARELAALPALSEAARSAFSTISERVERSLFALRSLDRSDWEAARSAYANFALARIDSSNPAEVTA